MIAARYRLRHSPLPPGEGPGVRDIVPCTQAAFTPALSRREREQFAHDLRFC